LHRERIESGHKRTHPIRKPLRELPDGTMVVIAGSAFTLCSARAYRWTSAGYAPPEQLHHADALLTPPSTVQALAAGYRPVLHPAITI
jgi:hypothetical protein